MPLRNIQKYVEIFQLVCCHHWYMALDWSWLSCGCGHELGRVCYQVSLFLSHTHTYTLYSVHWFAWRLVGFKEILNLDLDVKLSFAMTVSLMWLTMVSQQTSFSLYIAIGVISHLLCCYSYLVVFLLNSSIMNGEAGKESRFSIDGNSHLIGPCFLRCRFLWGEWYHPRQ